MRVLQQFSRHRQAPVVRRTLQTWGAAFGAALTSAACFPTDEGVQPPLGEFNFPVGLALGPGGNRLYVANSDYDLRFNSGVLQVLDTQVLLEHLPRSCSQDSDCPAGATCGGPGATASLCVDARTQSPCGELGPADTNERVAHPGACAALTLTTPGLMLESARIAPFVADVLYLPEQGSRSARLVMPVRGDATLHWADVEGASGSGPVLDCGQSADTQECDADHRRGDEPHEAAPRGQTLPTEPFGITASESGDAVFVGHQSQGKVSVFENSAGGPELRTVLSGLPNNPMGLASVPAPAAASRLGLDYQPGVLVSFRYSGPVQPRLELLRYFDTDAAEPAAPYLTRAGSSLITTNSSGSDSRGLAVDASARTRCESGCEPTCGTDPAATASGECEACLLGCAELPLDVYMANRSPFSLLVGKSRVADATLGRDDVPSFSNSVPLRGGPSRVNVASVLDTQGQPTTRVFVLAFDAQLLYVFDPQRGEVEMHIETGPGPAAFVVDAERALGYLAHFTDSYLSVIDLDQRHSSYGRVLLNVGVPQSPLSSK